MDAVTLPPDLERFASEAIASGQYRDMSHVVAAGVALLQDGLAEVDAFVASLEAARDEADRDGWVELDDLLAEMDAVIAERDHAPA